MGKIAFENYSRLASSPLSPTERAGRYLTQKDAEQMIIADVSAKISLRDDDCFLDIGCGTGLLLIPLSHRVASATGIDHPDVIARLPHGNFSTISGNFLDLEITETYSVIVAYSVIQCLASADLFRFLDKAAALLRPGGRLLIGDISNVDKKDRFLRSAEGIAFEKDWLRRTGARRTDYLSEYLLPDDDRVTIDDQLVLSILDRLRKQGLDAFVLPQSPDLPFGHTREDILIVKP